MVSRDCKLEALFRHSVHDGVDALLRVLAPDELINWGALPYQGVLQYLSDRLAEELLEIGKTEEI